MGDMLVKAGDLQTAQRIYANAKLSPDYAQWQFKATLENRIEQGQANVDVFRTPRRGAAAGAAIVMGQSRFACMGCHRR
jgi:hypothetical protein